MERLKQLNAEILILTETCKSVDLGYAYTLHTTRPQSHPIKQELYEEGEIRVSIHSKYPMLEQLPTFRDHTSICGKFKTPLSDLAIYGTIIGNYGNRDASFLTDLEQQLVDFYEIASSGALCIVGDLNISFCDSFYHTEQGRNKLNTLFGKLKLINLTASFPNNIDHIVVTNTLVEKQDVTCEIWNSCRDKSRYSDHKGVAVTVDTPY